MCLEKLSKVLQRLPMCRRFFSKKGMLCEGLVFRAKPHDPTLKQIKVSGIAVMQKSAQQELPRLARSVGPEQHNGQQLR